MILNATKKGWITGALMVALGVLLLLKKSALNSPFEYFGYLIYGAGIIWSIYPVAKQGTYKFGSLFNQGFRCFVIVTLIMSIYTFIFWKTNTQLIDSNIAETKQYYLKNSKDRTPAEIEQQAKDTRNYYIPIRVSGAVMNYLLTGAIITAVAAGALSLSRKN